MQLQTSIDAFQILRDTGVLNKCQLKVYMAAKSLFRPTNAEIAEYLGWSINRVTPRVKELRDMNPPWLGFYKTRICKVTKNPAMTWRPL